MQKLIELLQGFGSPTVALVGDFMLDRYVYGDAERVSPEAPVPILRCIRSESRTGGAGNVAAAITALGGKVVCLGVAGQDANGDELIKLLSACGAKTHAMIRLADRPTIVKTRFVGLAQHRHPQQMLRVDEESARPMPREIHATMRAALKGILPRCKVLVIEDHNKGVLDETLTEQFISDAVKAGLAVVVDPGRGIGDYKRYRGCTILKPNRYEAESASGVKIVDDASLALAARKLIESADAQGVVITLDKEGAYLMTRGGEGKRIPTRPRAVYDITGAGDEVVAMLAVALAQGCGLEDAVGLANVAGQLEVERFGVVPITRLEVLNELRGMIGLRGSKVVSRELLAEEISRRKAVGHKVVFTNGCFDLLHMGHVRYLQQAREMGSCLVVAINSDDSVQRLKGPSRPIIGASERAQMLASLECVDYVTVFYEDTPRTLLEMLRPDVLVKGGTTPVVVGREIVEAYGGKVVTLAAVEGLSTTEIINRIMGNGSGKD
jgi:D-beta-D-heptose 7-phosphate kinase/D-beta-D-heptose 1-phosphate adenosyltransferase